MHSAPQWLLLQDKSVKPCEALLDDYYQSIIKSLAATLKGFVIRCSDNSTFNISDGRNDELLKVRDVLGIAHLNQNSSQE